MLGHEAKERTINIAEARSALCAVKEKIDDCVAAGVHFPGTGDLNRGAGFDIEASSGEVFDIGLVRAPTPPARE